MMIKNSKKTEHVLPEQLYLDLQAGNGCLTLKDDKYGEVIILSKDKYQQELGTTEFRQQLENIFLQAFDLSGACELSLEDEKGLIKQNNFAQIKLCPKDSEQTPFIYVKNYYETEAGETNHFWVKMNASFLTIVQVLCLVQRWGKFFSSLPESERLKVLAELNKLLQD